MLNSKLISGFIFSASLLCPAMASAQIYDGAAASFQNDFSVQASVGFKIPLGATNRKKVKHQPRLDLGLDLARTSSGPLFPGQTGPWSQSRVNLLDVGLYGTKKFSLRLSGQELYGPTFSAIYADETDAPTAEDKTSEKGSGNTAKWFLGGVAAAAVAALVVGAIIVEDVNDTLNDIDDSIGG